MKTSVPTLAFAVALLVFTSTSMAQNQERGRERGQGGRFGMGMGTGSTQLLQNEKVQKELELTGDQVDQLKKIADEAPSFRDFQDLSREEITKKREETQKKVDEVLLPHQKDRLKELQIQLSGSRALLQDDVAEKLNLSSEQKEKLREVLSFRRGQNRGQGGERPNREDFAKRMEEQNQKAMDVLTAEQKDQFEKMKGKKADITMQDLFRGFGGRGDGNRGRGQRGNGEGRGAGEGRAPRDA
ncbi:MAG: hypothetical protein IT427_18820 [Pirellulales bacterium]|nr:hypothetical protein [Pirellulales bacterium]